VLYANDPDGNLIEPSPKAQGTCSLCKLPLIPKCGPINIWHWSRRAGDCDPWNEGETDWHRGWKKRADRAWCEVVMPPHRADIRRADGLVIELQYSSISADDIAAREAVYGNMWWLFHRDRFGKNARFFLENDGTIHMPWLNGSRTLPRVTKPMFCDLGGPIVEFTERLGRGGGHGRLLGRQEFLEKVGLRLLDGDELHDRSHHEVRWERRESSGAQGVIAPSEADLRFWCAGVKIDPREVRSYRYDGSFEVVPHVTPE
jgi:hypothetical protein